MLVASNDIKAFAEFCNKVFGASSSFRNDEENLIIVMASGMLTGTKNGAMYNITGNSDLLKNVSNLWAAALESVSASACTVERKESI